MKKLLSHRTRGFAQFENSLEGLKAALDYKRLLYFETDVRLSKDGVVHIHHDPYIKKGLKRIYLCQHKSEALTRNYGIPTLEEYLKVLSNSGNTNIGFCIDIKDYGVEEKIHDLLIKYEIKNEMYFITWIPESIIKLNTLGYKNIYYSYYPTKNFLLKWVFDKFPKLSVKLPFTFLHITGPDYSLDQNPSNAIGFQRVIITEDIPSRVLSILQNNEGGVCLEYGFVRENHLIKVRTLGLKVMLFQLRTKLHYADLKDNDLVDIIVSDYAKDVLDAAVD